MGFQWIKGDDAQHNILSYIRWGADGSAVLAVVNLSGSSQPNYRLGSPKAGTWDLLINTDAGIYGGADNPLAGEVHTEPTAWDQFDQSLSLHIPAMSVQLYKLRG